MSPNRERREPDASRDERDRSSFKAVRHGLKGPEIDAEPWRSPLDALAKGLVSIGDKLKFRPPLRIV
jgi:hypothetical protein